MYNLGNLKFQDMRIFANKWGNSLGVRIPKKVAEALGISENTELELNISNDKLIIHKTNSYSLDVLLNHVSKSNLHNLQNYGTPLGKEVW